jgi:hypothetical protein
VRFTDSGTPLCVNNEGGTIEVSDTPCTDVGVPTTWTSSDDIASYLGVSTQDASNAAAFLAEFGTEASLGADDAWSAAGDEDLYWPASFAE